METVIQLQPKQKEALQTLSNVKYLGYGGAKGGGKSYLQRAWQVMRRDKYSNTHGVIIRKTYPELYDNHIKKMWEEYPILRKFYNESKKMITFPNGSTLTFRHLERASDVYKFQGSEFEDYSIDESTQHSEEVFQYLRSGHRTSKDYIKPKFLLTFNWGGIGHGWCKRLFYDKEFKENESSEDYAFIAAKVYDNFALLNADSSYIKTLESLPEKLRKLYLDGDPSVFEGQFFTEWDNQQHVITPRYELYEAPKNFRYCLCWDDGTFNPRAVYLLAQNNDGNIEVIYEYYRAGETAVDAAINIRTELEELKVLKTIQEHGHFVYDPSMDIKSNQTGLSTSSIVAKELGMRPVPANNNRIEGARRFREYIKWDKFHESKFRVWSTCKNLIRTIPALIHDDHNNEDVDTEGEDHAYDAVRYGLMFLSPRTFKRKIGEEKDRVDKPLTYIYKPQGGYR